MTHVTKTGLKGRGWTDSLIEKFYPIPSRTKENPYYKNAAPACYYNIEIIKSIEADDRFKQLKEKSRFASISALQAVETKKNKVLNEVESFHLELPNITKNELIKKAVKHYNDCYWWKESMSENSSPDILLRICLNYVRHCLTEYDIQLENLYGKTGIREARKRLHEIIHEKAIEKYNL